jgi:hypothetical protein
MKAAPGLAELLAGRQFAIADLYTITLRDGTILRYTSCDIDLVYSGQTYLANALKIRRGPITTSVGVEVDAVELTIECDGTDTLFGQPIPAFVRNGGLDGARVLIQRAFLGDQTGPTALIVIDDTYIVRNGTATVTFTFNDVVTGFTLDDVTADNGTLSGLTTTDNITFTATFTAANPAGEFVDSTNSIVVDLAGVADLSGTYGVGTAASNNYTFDASYWLQRGAVLTASDAGENDQYGTSIALNANGTTLAVGAVNWDSSFTDQGGVYIYDWNGASWVQRGSVLTASDASEVLRFGFSISLSADGTVLAVGTSNWDGAFANQGGVYIYDWNGAAWVRRGAVLTAADAVSGDWFGRVALNADGTILVVGAHNRNGSRGGVYIYDWTGSAWVQRGSVLTASDAAEGDNFGGSISLSDDGSILAVGAYNWEGANTNQGGVYIYDWTGSAWVQRGSVLTANDAAAGDQFGVSVCFNGAGTLLAVGAYNWEGSLTNQGGAYIYDTTL